MSHVEECPLDDVHDFEILKTPQPSEDDEQAPKKKNFGASRPPKVVRDLTSHIEDLRKEVNEFRNFRQHVEATLVVFGNNIKNIEGRLQHVQQSSQRNDCSITGIQHEVQRLASAITALETPSDSAEGARDGGNVDPQDSNNFVFINRLMQKSFMVAEGGRRVVEIGSSDKGTTVLLDPPMTTGVHTLILRLNRGVKYSEYVGVVIDADFVDPILGSGSSDARLGVEVPLSWGFSCRNGEICTTFEPMDASEWLSNPGNDYAGGTSRFWSKLAHEKSGP